VRKSLIAACICVGLYSSGARAADITLTSQLSQSAEFNSNYFLATNPPGEVTSPISTLRVNALALTPTTRFNGTADLSYQTYFGPGVDNFIVTPALNKGARVTLDHTEKLTTYNVRAAWSQQQAAPLQLAQIGVATIGGFITTEVIQGGLRHELTPRDVLSWQNSFTSTSFSTPTSVPFTDLSTTGDWTHRVSTTTSLIPSVQYEQLNYGGTSNVEIMLWRLMMGMSFQPSARFSFYAQAGALVATARQSQNANANLSNIVSPIALPSNPDVLTAAPAFQPAIFIPGGATVAQSGSASAVDWLANIRATYSFDSTTQVTLVAAQSVSPDSFGNIFKTDSVGVVLSRQVNYSTSLTFSADASRFTSIGTVQDFYTAAATYGYRFTREWDSAVSYTFRQRHSDTAGSANSHGLFVLVRRDVTIIP
jgi:hypothetical protein